MLAMPAFISNVTAGRRARTGGDRHVSLWRRGDTRKWVKSVRRHAPSRLIGTVAHWGHTYFLYSDCFI